MIYIRPINVNDNFAQYMECVEDLNSSGVELASVEQIKRALSSRPSNIITYVIVDKESIVATATCIFERKLRYNQLCCHIEDVGVHKDYRSRGFGKLIVDHCISAAVNKRCYKAKLFCSNELEPFYRSMGFRKNNLGMEKILV
jgi:ribosomal protein S18 acetylase RimI-like enzyme